MKGIFLLLTIFGSVLSLQHPLEYHYQYEGRIASGIPSIRAQAVALGIRAKLVLLMKEKTQAVAKLVDVEVAEYNDDIVCLHLRAPISFTWKPMPSPHKENLEQPFAIYFAEESGHVMKVPVTDIEFVTNIRKSIVEMLRSQPLIGNLGGIKGDELSKFISGGKKPDAFSVVEETILGRCESQYSITRLPQHQAEMEKLSVGSHIQMDEQSEDSPRNGATNLPKLKDHYWHLVRSINLDNCTDRTMQEHAGGIEPHHLGRSQFRSVHSRSSVSNYLLKGLPGSFRVERAVVEGDVIVNPFGFKSEKLQTIINQTLVLEKAQPITTVIRLPAVRPVKSWQYEVSSPFPAPNHPKQWMNYHNKGDKYYPVSLQDSVGLPSTKEEIQEHQKSFMSMMDKVIENLYTDSPVPPPSPPSKESTKSSVASSFLHRMTKIMKVLPLDAVREIFNDIFKQHDTQAQRKQTIVIDVAAASGASAPIKVLLEKIQNNVISKARTASIYWTLPNNIISPAVVPDLMNHVKSLDIEKEPMLTSSATINFASLAKRVCLENRTSNLAIPNDMYGKEECERSLIDRDFLHFLSEKAMRSSKPFDKAVYIQAISNLGSPKILPVLKQWIHAEHERSANVRLTAIYGLSKKRLPESERERVFDILMPIVESVEERADIRQAAVAALISWHPHASWWQRMARSTWKERNNSMAAFIAFSLESLSKSTEPRLLKQARIAEFVLPMAKPFSPSQKYSFNAIHSRYDQHSKIGADFVFSLIRSAARNEDSHAATEVYASLKENFGGLHWDMFEASLTSVKIPSVMEEWINTYGFEDREDILSSIPKSPMSRMIAETSYQMRPEPKEDHPSLFLRIFDNMYQYVDLKNVWEQLRHENLWQKVMQGHPINVTKHLNPVDIEFFLPTEMGLPLMGSMVMPTTYMVHAHVKLDKEDTSVPPTIKHMFMDKDSTWTLNSTTKYMSKLIVKMSAMAPWSKKMFEAGIENHHEINLPFSVQLKISKSEEISNATIHISPNDENMVPVLHSHNIPFTQVRNVVPSSEERFDYTVISTRKSEDPTNKIQKHFDSKYTGMEIEYDFAGDAPNPFTSANVKDYLRKPVLMGKLLTSPTAKQWQYSVSFDPKNSVTKHVDIIVSYLNLKPNSNQRVTDIPDISINDDRSQRLEKLRKLSEGSNVHGIDAKIMFNGSERRMYEAILTLTKKEDPSRNRTVYKTVMAALADRIPGQTNDPQALCAETVFDTPTVHKLEDLRRVLDTDVVENIDSKMFYGTTCESTQITKTKGTLKMSSERQIAIKEEINRLREYDAHDPTVHLPIAVVYDQVKFEMNFDKDKIPKPLINMTLSLRDNIDGLLFPRGYYDNMHVGEQNKITLEAFRPLYSDGYNFWVEMPHRHAIYSEIHVPNVVTRLVPWVGLVHNDPKNSNFVLTSEETGKCTIKKGVMYSFDGLKFNFAPLHCWTKVAVNLENPSLYEVLVSETKVQMLTSEIRISREHTKVSCTYGNATINGKLMDKNDNKRVVNDRDGRPIIEVFRRNSYFEMHLINNMTVKVYKTYIEITPEDHVRAKLRGVCGDFDGSVKYDKTGPNGCLYLEETKDVLFKYAWTERRGLLCDVAEYDKEEKEVQDYQKNCTRRPETVWSSSYENDNCYQKVFPMKRIGPGWCVSKEPVQVCTKQCNSHGFIQQRVETGCWPDRVVPSDVRAAESEGYMIKPPAETAPFQSYMTVHWDTVCQ